MEKALNENCSTKSEYKYLPPDEERGLLRRAKAGEAAAMVRLMNQYEPLILAAARRSAFRPIYEDALAAGYLAFLAAVREYDEGRGVYFAAWARAKVHGDLATLLKREIRRWQRESAAEDASESAEKSAGAEKFDCYAQIDARLALKQATARLDEREKRIVAAIAVERQSAAAIAPQFGLTPQRVGQIYRAALKKMRKAIGT